MQSECWLLSLREPHHTTPLPHVPRPRNFFFLNLPQPALRYPFQSQTGLLWPAFSSLPTRLRISHVSSTTRVSRVHREPCQAIVSVSCALRSSSAFPLDVMSKRACYLCTGHVPWLNRRACLGAVRLRRLGSPRGPKLQEQVEDIHIFGISSLAT